MGWNIGFSRKFFLKIHTNLGLFNFVQQDKTQKYFAFCYIAEFERRHTNIPF